MFGFNTPAQTVVDTSPAESWPLATSRGAFFGTPKRGNEMMVTDAMGGAGAGKRQRTSLLIPSVPTSIGVGAPNTGGESNAVFTHSLNLRSDKAHHSHLADFHCHLIMQSVSEYAPTKLSDTWHLSGMSSNIDNGSRRSMNISRHAKDDPRSISHHEAYPLPSMNARLIEDQMGLLRELERKYHGGHLSEMEVMDVIEALPAQIMAKWAPAGVCHDEAGTRTRNGHSEKLLNCVTRGRTAIYNPFTAVLSINTAISAVLRFVTFDGLRKRNRVYFKDANYLAVGDIDRETNNSLPTLKELSRRHSGASGVFLFVPYGRPGQREPCSSDLSYRNFFGGVRLSPYVVFGIVRERLITSAHMAAVSAGAAGACGVSGKSKEEWRKFNSPERSIYWNDVMGLSKRPLMEIAVQVHGNRPTTSEQDFTALATAEEENEAAHARSAHGRFTAEDADTEGAFFY